MSRRLWRGLGWGVGLPLLLVTVLLALLLFTGAGVQVAAGLAQRVWPSLVLEGLDGTLAQGVRARQIQWRDAGGVIVRLDGLATRWNPRCLLRSRVCLDSLIVGALHVALPPSLPATADTPFQPLALPLLVLPGRLELGQLHLAEIRIGLPEGGVRLGPAHLQGHWAGSRLVVENLRLQWQDPVLGQAGLQLAATLDTRSEWPLSLNLGGHYRPAQAGWGQQTLQLEGEGNLRHLHLNGRLHGELAPPGLPPLALAADLVSSGLDTELTLHRLDGQYAGAPLSAQGKAGFSAQGRAWFEELAIRWGENRLRLQGQWQQGWDLVGELVLAQPALLAEGARGQLAGSLHLTGATADPRLQARLASRDLQLPGLQLQQAQLEADLNPVTGRQLRLHARVRQLETAGHRLDDLELNLDGDAAAHRLHLRTALDTYRLDTRLSGRLDPARYDWQGQITALALQLQPDWTLNLHRPASLRWEHRQRHLRLGRHCLDDGQARLCASLDQYLPADTRQASLEIRDFDLARLQPWLPADLQLAGRLHTRLQARGHWQNPWIQGELQLDGLDLQTPSQPERHLSGARLQARFSGRQARLDTGFELPPAVYWQNQAPIRLTWGQGHRRLDESCWQASRQNGTGADRLPLGQLCLAGEQGARGVQGQGRADIDLAGVLQPWLPPGLAMQGRLAGRGEFRRRGHDLNLSLDAGVEQGTVLLARDDDDPLALPFQTLHLQASLRQKTLETRLELQSASLGSGTAQARIELTDPEPRLAGTARLDGFDLGILRPLFPHLGELEGQLSLAGQASGPLIAPRLDGEAHLQNLVARSPFLPQGIDDLDARLTLHGDQGELQGTLVSGDGQADLSGQLHRGETGWQAALQLHGRDMAIRQPPDLILEMQPDLTLDLSPRQVHLGGTLTFKKGFVWIKELPEGSVSPSADTLLVDAAAPAASTPGGPALSADVRVQVRKKLRLRGLGGDVKLEGEVRVFQEPGGLLWGRGVIDVVEGSYTGYGQQLKVRRGKLLFNGPLDQPFLSLEAVREVGDVVAGLRVIGPASEPEATLFSEPALPDSQILYYLLTGKAPGTGTREDSRLVQEALLGMGLLGGNGTLRNVASKVGIEDLRVAAGGSGDSTQVQVSGYLSSRAYVQYGINVFQPVNTLTLRYRLRDNLFLEAVSGLASALDLLYTFEF